MARGLGGIRPGVRLFALVGLLFAGDMALGWSPTHPQAAVLTVWNMAAQWPPTRGALGVAGHILVIVEQSAWYRVGY